MKAVVADAFEGEQPPVVAAQVVKHRTTENSFDILAVVGLQHLGGGDNCRWFIIFNPLAVQAGSE